MKLKYSIPIALFTLLYTYVWFLIFGFGSAGFSVNVTLDWAKITFFSNEIVLYNFFALYGIILLGLSVLEKNQKFSNLKLQMNSIYLGTTGLFLLLSIYQGLLLMKDVIIPSDVKAEQTLFWLRLNTFEQMPETFPNSDFYNFLLPLTVVMLFVFLNERRKLKQVK